MPPLPATAEGGGRVWVDPGRAVPAATAIGRTALATPPAVDGSVRVDLYGPLGLPGTAIELIAADLANALAHHGSPEEAGRNARFMPADPPSAGFPRLTVGAAPGLDFGRDAAGSDWAGRALLDLRASVEPVRGVAFAGEMRTTPAAWGAGIAGRPVRVGRAYAVGATRLWDSGYALVEAGLLEESAGGFGGELLWRPFDARWAVSVELHRVWRREPDVAGPLAGAGMTLFGATVAWDAADGTRFSASPVRFLDGGSGLELSVERRWIGGSRIAIGMVADGWIAPLLRVTVPLGSGGPFGSEAWLKLRPQDAATGRRLNRPARLLDLTAPASFGAVTAGWDRLLD